MIINSTISAQVPHIIDLTSSLTNMTLETRSQLIGTSTATSRVVTVAELVRHICEHSDRAQNSRNARVCKLWSSEALSVVWRRLHSFLPLLKLLAPMSLQYEDGTRRFVRSFRLPSCKSAHDVLSNTTDRSHPTAGKFSDGIRPWFATYVAIPVDICHTKAILSASPCFSMS